jgi:hypothetical protein
MSSIYNKYLKYKTKYLQLINNSDNVMVGGSMHIQNDNMTIDELSQTQNIVETHSSNNHMVGGSIDDLLLQTQNIVEAHSMNNPMNNSMIGGNMDTELFQTQNIVEAHSMNNPVNNSMIGGNMDNELFQTQNIVEAHSLNGGHVVNEQEDNAALEAVGAAMEHERQKEIILAHPIHTNAGRELYNKTEQMQMLEGVMYEDNRVPNYETA